MSGAEGPRTRLRRLPRRFFEADAVAVAPLLLNKVLVAGPCRARIVEVEAYMGGGVDPSSHSHKGPGRRNATMFGRPGLLYVYFTYGMHWCCNVVTGPEGHGQAVLLRAAEPIAGAAAMRERRGPRVADRDLCRGPARLGQAFGFTGTSDGLDLCRPSAGGPYLADDGTAPPADPVASTRIGVSADHPWRWLVAGSRYVSHPRHGAAIVTRPPSGGVTSGEKVAGRFDSPSLDR